VGYANEPNGLVVNSYVGGQFPPGKKDFKAAFRAVKNLIRGHAASWHAIHDLQADAMASYALYYRGFFPKNSWSPLDALATRSLKGSVNEVFSNAIEDGRVKFALYKDFIREAIGTQDYVGIQYYSSDMVSFNPFKPGELFTSRCWPPGVAQSETGFMSNFPEGLTQALKWARQFKLPIYITENGVEDSTDALRPTYLAQHLHKVSARSQLQLPVKGYFTGRRWIILNGSVAGRSALGCGSWTL
jgi:beta-glucosidase